MKPIEYSVTVNVPAPPAVVWSVMVDVERWPEWTSSISRVKRLSPGPFGIGSQVRIHQPGFPPARWQVTDLQPGAEFTWVSAAPALRVTARHAVQAVPDGSQVTLSIRYEGLFGRWLARATRRLNEQYLAMEANGLRDRCAALAPVETLPT